MSLLRALLHVFEAAVGMFIVLSVWLGIQNFVRWRSGCGGDRDMLEFMLRGCGSCADNGNCIKRKHHESL